MKVVQITEDKLGNISECVDKMLHYGGKLMTCIEELGGGSYSEEGYSERSGRMGQRGGYSERGGRMGHRDWNEMDRFPGNDPRYYGDRGLAERHGDGGRFY